MERSVRGTCECAIPIFLLLLLLPLLTVFSGLCYLMPKLDTQYLHVKGEDVSGEAVVVSMIGRCCTVPCLTPIPSGVWDLRSEILSYRDTTLCTVLYGTVRMYCIADKKIPIRFYKTLKMSGKASCVPSLLYTPR